MWTLSLIFLLSLIAPNLSQDSCYTGSSLQKFPVSCNFTSGQQCMTGLLRTQIARGIYLGGYTEIFACAFPQQFLSLQSAGVMSNVTGCNSGDLCVNTTFPLPAAGTCESLTNESACTARSDCYYCADSLVGIGLCKNGAGFPAPCFAMAIPMPPPICGFIQCYTPIPYTNDIPRLSKEFLYAFGWPNPGFDPNQGNFSVLIAVDISSRQFHTINETYRQLGFCETDNDLMHWCGVNGSQYPNGFRYCLATNRWPQPDVWGWLQNTTFTSNKGISPYFPSICACPIDGRAYYIPYSQVFPDPYFGSQCNAEWAWLALWILLMILFCIVFLLILYDTAVLIYLYTTKEKKASLGSQTLWVKICMICYFLVTIPDMGLIVSPHTTAQLESAQLLLRLLGIVFILYSYVISVFTFVEIFLKSKVFGNFEKLELGLKIFKWIFFAFNTFMLFVCVVLASVYGYYVEVLQDFRVDSLQEFLDILDLSQALGQTIVLLLISLQFIMIVVTAILLSYLAYLVFSKASNFRGQRNIKQLAVRVIFLLGGCLMAIPNLAIFIIISWILAWILASDSPSAWPSAYLTFKAFDWFVWGELATELLWMCFIAYAMRTVVQHSIIYRQMKSRFGGASRSSTSSASAASRGKSARDSNSTNSTPLEVRS